MESHKIKIITGWGHPGGSTTALINLCNLFNEKGHDCTLYAMNGNWYLGKCKSDLFERAKVNEENEVLILHYVKFPYRPDQSRMVILNCHEKDIFPVKDCPQIWDEVVYVSDSQKEWHGVSGEVIPNVIPKVEFCFADRFDKTEVRKLNAGCIGSIDANKQTHVSIQRALDDGWKTVFLFGLITDQNYYEEKVKPYVDKGLATVVGYEEDRQKMYNFLDKVYHSSKSETFNFIKAECEQAQVKYDGLESAESGATYWDNEEVYEKWMKIIATSEKKEESKVILP